MYGINTIYHYLSQFNSYVCGQQKQILKLKNDLELLQNQMKEIREKAPTTIEKIEYKFDQLKIETLEGTLNIGLTPTGITDPETIENFSVNESPPGTIPILQKFPTIYQRIHNDVKQFLEQDCQQIMNETATQYNINLDEPYRTFIMQDIERQLDERIHYYLNQIWTNNTRNTSEDDIHLQVLEKIKKDISNAIDTFIKHLPKGGHYKS